MNTQLATIQQSNVTAYTAPEMKARAQRIQQVMRSVMKEGTHYGKIPGTSKPSLWKPGAEVLCVTFHVATSYRVEDLSDGDCVRYRVVAVGTHAPSGVTLGEGLGEASSNEEKYKWRKAASRAEFDATAEDRRRIKYGYSREDRREYEIQQVRTEPADVANTILKMACKRAQVAMALNVTAASDIFSQDLEDMPEELREHVAREPEPRNTKPATKVPQATGEGKINPGQLRILRKALDKSGVPEADFLKKFEIAEVVDLPFAKLNDALKWVASVHAPAAE